MEVLDDDDDVVMKGSELYKYLEGQGLTDYGVAGNPVFSNNCLEVPEATKQTWWSTFKFFRTSHPKNPRCLYKEITLILKSGLVFPEDCQMVENVIPELEESKGKNSSWPEHVAVHCAVAGGAFLLWYRHAVTFIVPAMVSCCSGCIWLMKLHETYSTLQRVKIIQEMLNSQLHFSMLLKKTMKLLKELEMFEKGLTLTTIGQSKMTEGSNLLLSAKHWSAVPQLRAALASSCIDVIKLLMKTTKFMVLSFPIGLSCDSQSNYIAFFSGKEMGIGDSLKNERHAEWSITDLQKLHDTFLLLQSEFLRRLCMCFSEDLCPESFTRMSDLLGLCETLNFKLVSVTDTLVKEFRTYKQYKKEENKEIQRGKAWQYSDIYASTHHVSLHLQYLLHQNDKLEQMLQEVHGGEPRITEEKFLQQLESSVSALDKQLDLCKSSVNDVAVQIKNLLNKSADISNLRKIPSGDKLNESQMQNFTPVLVGHSDWDPPGEDEIFEEVISHESVRGDCDNEFYMNAEGITEMKTRKLFSQKVLTELKGALVVKREEWKVREENALKKKLLKDGTITSPEEYPEYQNLADKILNSKEETDIKEDAHLGTSNKCTDENYKFEGKFPINVDAEKPLPNFNEALPESCTSNPFKPIPDADKAIKTFLTEAPRAISTNFLMEDLFSGDGESFGDET